MSRKTVSMIGNLTRDMMSDVMETSLKKPIQTGEFRKNPVDAQHRQREKVKTKDRGVEL